MPQRRIAEVVTVGQSVRLWVVMENKVAGTGTPGGV